MHPVSFCPARREAGPECSLAAADLAGTACREATCSLTRPRVKTALDRFTGCVLIGFGLRLATER